MRRIAPRITVAAISRREGRLHIWIRKLPVSWNARKPLLPTAQTSPPLSRMIESATRTATVSFKEGGTTGGSGCGAGRNLPHYPLVAVHDRAQRARAEAGRFRSALLVGALENEGA